MWVYIQATGEIFNNSNGEILAKGYSGFGEGKNNPGLQNKVDIGPIPQGLYTISDPECIREIGLHGPYVLPLLPDPDNCMFGRSGFLIHGDSLSHAGSASHGCIILPYLIRLKIGDSSDKRLTVLSGISNTPVKNDTKGLAAVA